jgi:hypothetical protein
MSIMGQREEREREVLATLLLTPSSHLQLPDDFANDAFEFPEYRKLFDLIWPVCKKGSASGKSDFVRLYPDQHKVINDVTYATSPLNGQMGGRASALMNHWGGVQSIEEASSGGPADWSGPPQRFTKFEFQLMNGLEISAMELPPKEWLVSNLITASSVNFLAGEEGCGKSLLAMNLALSVATGTDSWLNFPLPKAGKVLYLNNEMAFDDFARRLKAMSLSMPVMGDISNLVVPREVPALRECWDTLNRTCEEVQPCLVVIDCLYFSHDEDENDSSAMKSLMRKVLSLRDSYHLAVLLVHHTKKGSRYTTMHNDQMRGSSVFGGIADTTLQIRRSDTEEGKRILKPLKGRHVADEVRKCRLLSLNPETLWFKDEGETNEADHIAIAPKTAADDVDFENVFAEAKELSRKDIQERCKPLGYDERTIDRLIKKKLKQAKYGHYSL